MSAGAGSAPGSSLVRELPVSVERARAAVTEAAERWGADWDPETGTISLPLAAGLRVGVGRGSLAVEPRGNGSHVRLAITEQTYWVRWNAVVVLLLAAAGGVVCGLWPFLPRLLPWAPFGAVLALLGWFLVVSRLVTNSPGEFLDTMAELSQEEAPA